MGTTAAGRKAAERINRQVAPWRYRADLEHAIGVAAGRAWPYGDAITRAELVERTVALLVQRNKNAPTWGWRGWKQFRKGSLVTGIGRHSDAGASTARRLAGSGSCAKSAWKNPRQPKLTGEGIETWNDR